MCKKVKFDEVGAMLALADHLHLNTNKQKKRKRKEIRYYYCKHCKAYHLTSKPKKEKDK